MSDCILCAKPLSDHERQTCTRCIGRVRADLATIAATYALLPDELEHHPDDPIPGGDALVMLAPGSTGSAAIKALLNAPGEWTGDKWDIAAGEPTFAHYADENPADPPTILFDLSRWQDDWAESRDEKPGRPTMTDVVGWLTLRLTWAGEQHPAFDEFAVDVHRMLVRLQISTATGEWPLYGARCQYDDTLLVREYRDPEPCKHGAQPAYERRVVGVDDRGRDVLEPASEALFRWLDAIETWQTQHEHCDQGGLTAMWHCLRCRRRYNDEEYRLALRKQAGAAVGWMPLHLAADLAGVSQKDLRNWMDRGHIAALCNLRWHDDKAVRTGPLMVFWADVLVRVAARKAA